MRSLGVRELGPAFSTADSSAVNLRRDESWHKSGDSEAVSKREAGSRREALNGRGEELDGHGSWAAGKQASGGEGAGP